MTKSSLGDVVCDEQHDVRDVEHLADDRVDDLGVAEILAAVSASGRGVRDGGAGNASCEVRPRRPGLLALGPSTRSRRTCLRPPLGPRLAS